MSQQRTIFFCATVAIILAVCCSLSSFMLPDTQKHIYKTDSSFIVNSTNGWSSLNSYLDISNDSVVFELILQHDLPSDTLFWKNRNEIGTVSAPYAPGVNQIVLYSEGKRDWALLVTKEGICSLLLLDGPVPQNNPVILPVQTRYKK